MDIINQMDAKILKKLETLKQLLSETKGCAIAYSGGVDSTFLLTVAYEVLGEKTLAVIATSSTYPKKEYDQALRWVREKSIPHIVIVSEELDIPGFRDNPPNRCYFCKKELFSRVRQEALRRGIPHVADGSNADDTNDYRPGMLAARELDVLSPLKSAALTKNEIRSLSREIYHLPTADKPAMACLASRFPYHSTITGEKLHQVESVETFLADHGLYGSRARHHGQILRLELPPDKMAQLLESPLRESTIKLCKDLGFTYITLDLEGYRAGSLNEVLRESQKQTDS
ncbi:MAG: ATP-dependent sacrificial sulfur transferase LarE [Phycisphaerae bacterium]